MEKLWDGLREMLCTIHQLRICVRRSRSGPKTHLQEPPEAWRWVPKRTEKLDCWRV